MYSLTSLPEDLMGLSHLMLTSTPLTAKCEPGFSAMNHLKCNLRTTLVKNTLSDLMQMHSSDHAMKADQTQLSGRMMMLTISIVQISIWIWSNALYKFSTFQRAQLNEVGLKEPCYRLGPQPLNTTHIWPRSNTAPQPDGLDWESILRREETGVPGENPRSQVEINWNSIHIQHL